jgi:hypothetical protein
MLAIVELAQCGSMANLSIVVLSPLFGRKATKLLLCRAWQAIGNFTRFKRRFSMLRHINVGFAQQAC